MSVAISSLTGNSAQLATLVDAATGHPDGNIDDAELDAFDTKFPRMARGDGWWELRRAITQATIAAIPRERVEQLVQHAVTFSREAVSRDSRLNTWLTARGVTSSAEVELVDRLTRHYDAQRRDRREDVENAAVDGVITDAERVTLRASLKLEERNAPGARRVAEIGLIDEAEARARTYAAIYGESVRRGAVPGVDPRGPLQPPSAAVIPRLRDGSLLASLAQPARDAATALITRHSPGWPRVSMFVQQVRVDDLAKELAARWDAPGNPSAPRIMQALFSEPRLRDEPAVRANLAAALMSRLSDSQLAALDDGSAIALMAAAFGGGSTRIDAGQSAEERRAEVLLSTSVAGPRTFTISQGRAPVASPLVDRMLVALSPRFEINLVNDRYYSPYYTLRAR